VATGNEEKRAENEASFRDANERIRAAERELNPPLERVPYLCECDDVGFVKRSSCRPRSTSASVTTAQPSRSRPAIRARAT
jgi:hypothetical protein